MLLAVCLLALPAAAHLERHLAPDPLPQKPPVQTAAWAVAIWCEAHSGWLASYESRIARRSPAGESLLAAVYGLLLFGPEARFDVRLLARGLLTEEGRSLQGDLCLRGLHPSLVQEPELWKAVRAVRRLGLQRVRGRVLWETSLIPVAGAAPVSPEPWLASGQPASQQQPLRALEERLRSAGVLIEPAAGPSAAPQALPGETELERWESRPLAVLLRRDLTLLRPMLPEPEALRRLLGNLDPLHHEWVPQGHPASSPEESVHLLRQALRHAHLGSEIGFALQPLALGPAVPPVRGLLLRDARMTELLGIAELPGHGPIVIDLRVEAEAPDEKLAARLAEALGADPGGEAPPWLALQELPALQSSSE